MTRAINKSGRNNRNAASMSNVLVFSLFGMLAGIYICPEYIKVFAALYMGVVAAYAWFNVFSLGLSKQNESKLFARKCLDVTLPSIAWVVFMMLGLICCVANGAQQVLSAIEFSVSIALGLLTLLFCTDPKTRKRLLYAVGAVSVIAMLGCVIQSISPEILSRFTAVTLNASQFASFRYFCKYEFLVGFSYQTGVTGYYLGVFLGFVLCALLFGKNCRKLDWLGLLGVFAVGTVFVLLTGKRSVLLLVAVLTYGFICYYNRKNLIKIVCVTVLLPLVAVILLSCTEAGRLLVERTLGSSPLSGRDVIYAQLFEMFKQSPVFGHGFGSTLTKVQGFTNGHNIYLQILAETGLVGFVILGTVFAYNLFTAVNVLRKCDSQDKMTAAICVYLQLFFLGIGLFGNPLYDVFPLVIYMISVGAVRS